jgi:hypothetical protein
MFIIYYKKHDSNLNSRGGERERERERENTDSLCTHTNTQRERRREREREREREIGVAYSLLFKHRNKFIHCGKMLTKTENNINILSCLHLKNKAFTID